MIIFLYGSDGYRLRQAKSEIISKYQSKYSSGVNLFYIDVREEGVGKIHECVSSSTFFNEHKLVVVSGAFALKKSADDLTRLITELSLSEAKETTFLFPEPSAKKELNGQSNELFGQLSGRKNLVRVFDFLKGRELEEWIKKEVQARDCAINRDALEELMNFSGDSWALINEINKLTSYKRRGEITLADIRSLSVRGNASDVFGLTDAVSAGNKPRSLEILYKELANGSDPYYLLAMIISQFRKILTVRDLADRGFSSGEISEKADMHPFVVKKIISLSSRSSVADLRIKFSRLLDIDTGSKQGSINLTDSLYKFLLS